MSQKYDNFLAKFSGQIEQVGKNGIVGLLQNTKEPVNSSKNLSSSIDKFSISNKYNRLSQSQNGSRLPKIGLNKFAQLKKFEFLDPNCHQIINQEDEFDTDIQNYYNSKAQQKKIMNPYNYYGINNMQEVSREKFSKVCEQEKSPFFIKEKGRTENTTTNLGINFQRRGNKSSTEKKTDLKDKPRFSYSLKNNNGALLFQNEKRKNITTQNSPNHIGIRAFNKLAPPQRERNFRNRNINYTNNLFSHSDFGNYDISMHLPANNRQNIIDHGYTPYTLKDYKNMPQEVRLGKLGANVGTKEWNEKQEKMKKMSEYGKKIMHEGKGCYGVVKESSEQQHNRELENKRANGKWKIINEYSKSLLTGQNRDTNVQFMRNEKYIQEEIEKNERRIRDEKQAEYIRKLDHMKKLLI